jgi:predicted RNA binding protein with dsRBD fold (UPF0201 family)
MRKSPTTAQFELKVEASVNPSEYPEKVITAITNVIDKCSPELRYGNIAIGRSAESESLSTIYDQVRSRSAIAVLRRMLLVNRIGNTTWFLLNKQAAVAGSAVIIENEQESPLGPITVTIDCEELDALVDWLAPP